MSDITEIGVILDRSGSMEEMKKDAIGGFNTFLDGLKKETKPSRLTLVQFDTEYETLHSQVESKNVPRLTDETFVPRGGTALLDAIGRTIDEIGKRLDKTQESDRPSKVLIVILTDGYENSSKNYTWTKVNEMISHQRQAYSWEFLFLAANQDAIKSGRNLGIQSNNCISTDATGAGNRAIGQTLMAASSRYMNAGSAGLADMDLQRSYCANVSSEEDKEQHKWPKTGSKKP
jgi:uncharacterized protein YegL